ncbi:MAG TPA: DinB family protein [Terriglobia bacterium]|nr:DinB family protein [Terriglobia bacterium]
MSNPTMAVSRTPIARPDPSEHAPYYGKYIALVPGDDIMRALETQGRETAQLLAGLNESQAAHRYAPDKWSVKEVIGHVTDSERIFCYRALRIARGDQTPIEGFEQDDYVRAAQFDRLSIADLAAEFTVVRRATLRLFASLSPDAWTRRGIANNNEVSVRALAYMIAGHELHHRRGLREKYGVGQD